MTTNYGNLFTWTPPETSENIVITGSTGFLGSHFLFWRLLRGGEIYLLVRGQSESHARKRVHKALLTCSESYQQPLDMTRFDQQIHILIGDLEKPLWGLSRQTIAMLVEKNIMEFWHCAASLKFLEKDSDEINQHNITGTQHTLELVSAIQAKHYWHISTAYVSGRKTGTIEETLYSEDTAFNNLYEASKNQAEHRVVSFCQEAAQSYSILRPTVIMGPKHTFSSGGTHFGVYGFIKELYQNRSLLKQVTTTIRLQGDPKASLNLVPVDHVVFDMLHLSQTESHKGKIYHLCSSHNLDGALLASMIGNLTCGIQLKLVTKRDTPASPLEAMIDQKGEFYQGYYDSQKSFVRRLPALPPITKQDLENYIVAYLHELDRADSPMVPTFIARKNGSQIRAFSMGCHDKPPVVLINAYGMSSDIFKPLAHALSQHYQVLTWELQGLPHVEDDFLPSQCSTEYYAQDFVRLLEHFQIPQVMLIAWCNGVQTALKIMATYPSTVSKAIFLNSGTGANMGPNHEGSSFQRKMNSLIFKIADDERLAKMYHQLILGNQDHGLDNSENTIVSGALKEIDPSLLHLVQKPFLTPRHLSRYAQIMKACIEEESQNPSLVEKITHPVLIYTGGEDEMADPKTSEELLESLTHSRQCQDPGSNHFAHYQRNNHITSLINNFFLGSVGPETDINISKSFL